MTVQGVCVSISPPSQNPQRRSSGKPPQGLPSVSGLQPGFPLHTRCDPYCPAQSPCWYFCPVSCWYSHTVRPHRYRLLVAAASQARAVIGLQCGEPRQGPAGSLQCREDTAYTEGTKTKIGEAQGRDRSAAAWIAWGLHPPRDVRCAPDVIRALLCSYE